MPSSRVGQGLKATYEGGAEGYASHGGNAGDITATVVLNATFGIDAPESNPSVTGKINEFRFVGGSKIPWNADISGTWNDADNPGNFDDSVGGDATGGKWGMTFYTTQTQGTGESEVVNKDSQPTNAVGTFDLTFSDGRAVGAFDAGREPAENTGN